MFEACKIGKELDKPNAELNPRVLGLGMLLDVGRTSV